MQNFLERYKESLDYLGSTKNSFTRALATEPPCREEKVDAVGPGKKINDSRAPVIPGTFLNAAEQQRQKRQQ